MNPTQPAATASARGQDIHRSTVALRPDAAPHPASRFLEPFLDRTRAAARCAVFVLKMIPPQRQPIDRLTRRPTVERVSLQTAAGPVEVELYRPRSPGPHPGVVASFGINPTGAMDPRVAQMGDALARAGFATLLYWPPAARDVAVEPADGRRSKRGRGRSRQTFLGRWCPSAETEES